MPKSNWIAHVKKVYAANKSRGWSYKKSMIEAGKTFKKAGKAKGKGKKGKEKGGALEKKKRRIKR